MALWGGGGNLVQIPLLPYPATLELGQSIKAAANENPFTGQQQIQNWQYHNGIGSCVLPPMQAPVAQSWQFFLDNCFGIVNVFQFMPILASDIRYYYWLTANQQQHGPQRYWRMMKNDYRVTMSRGGVFHLSFEFREAI